MATSFDEFWSIFPRKVSKRAALKAWEKELKAGTDPAIIIEGLKRQLPMLMAKDPQFIPHASTWLNGGRFEDELEPIRVPQQRRTLADAAAEFRSTLGHLNAPAWISDQSKH
jgi:hypothetical protein